MKPWWSNGSRGNSRGLKPWRSGKKPRFSLAMLPTCVPIIIRVALGARRVKRPSSKPRARAMARARGFDDGRFTLLAPSATRMMIGTHVGSIAKENLGFFPLRQGFNPREFPLEPLLHQGFIALLRAM